LIPWSDSRTTEDESNVIKLLFLVEDFEVAVAEIFDVASGTANLDFFAFLHAVEDVAQCAAGLLIGWEVCLDDEVEGAIFGVCSDDGSSWGVGADEHLVGHVKADLEMLAGTEAEFLGLVSEAEGVFTGVFRDFLLFGKSNWVPSCLTSVVKSLDRY
jgi:hypothetical protein